jgi:hypothetical protein
MTVLQRISFTLFMAAALSACQGSDFADVLSTTSTTPEDEATVACSISSSSPSTSTYKMANPGGTTTSFVAVPNNSDCTIAWKLNSVTVAGTSAIKAVTSADLSAGVNTIEVTVSNSLGSESRTWTVTRNQVPTCASKTPVANPTPFPFSYTPNLAFTGNFNDADGDALSSFTWNWNNSSTPTGIYTAQSSTANSASMTFVPTMAQSGTGNTLSVSFTDGYDTGTCSWTFDLTNPNVVQLLSCLPASNPVVIDSTGAGNSEALSINTLNASSFSWTKDAVAIGGATSSTYTANTTNPTFGTYTYVATASDSESNQVTCTFNVKMNGPPVISVASPTTSQTWRVNYASSLGFTVTASDPNSDALTYTWKLDGTVQTTYLNSTTNSATFSPGSADVLVTSNNPHTISVVVSDGNEETTQSWTVEVNKFSTECNTLLNGTVTSHGGKVCTLAGPVGVGSGRRPADDQTLMRVQPLKIIDDGYGNWFIMDSMSNSVFYYNRTGINPFTGDRSGCVANKILPVRSQFSTKPSAVVPMLAIPAKWLHSWVMVPQDNPMKT